MKESISYNHSIAKLIELLAASTKKLAKIMNRRGAGSLIRLKKIEIRDLKEVITRRQLPTNTNPY